MKCFSITFFLFTIFFNSRAQELPTANTLLENAIAYHDPNGNWSSFDANFKVTMTTPNQAPRASDITINLPAELFSLIAVRNNTSQIYKISKNTCLMFNDQRELNETEAQKKVCERAKMYKNYYTYLYGLPMKLKDNGTNIDPKVERKTFKGKDYLVLKATYDAEVGSDVWYFYFDPKTYAMEVYQFYKTDDNGKVKPDSGEYILLNEEETINGIKMPKIRAWYYNKDDKYLGTDTLGKV